MLDCITFAVALTNRKIYENNFLASPCLDVKGRYEVLEQVGFLSAAKAYNEAIERAANDLIIFVHQDVFLPDVWLPQVQNSLQYLERLDPNWGVLGCGGVTEGGQLWAHVYSTGWGVIGKPFEHPMQVRTLDEIVLILRKSSGLRFDERLPHFHLYGTEICLAAAKRGLRCHSIPAFCIHNTDQTLILSKEFYECYQYIKHTWKNCLPIQTPCITISRFDFQKRLRKLQELHLQILGAHEKPVRRAENSKQIWERLQAKGLFPPLPAHAPLGGSRLGRLQHRS